jgi:uncharacterized protein YbjQ (UPF0145 family)
VLGEPTPEAGAPETVPTTVEPEDVLLVTTESIQGRPIAAYLGIVGGEASVSIGPRGAASAMREARAVALDLIRSEAATLGAGAVVGLRLDTVVRKQDAAVLASGTAVRLR